MDDDGIVKPPKPEEQAVREWASDWADKFEQDWDEERCIALLGKRVDALRPAVDEMDGPKGFRARIVGYTIDTLTCLAEDDAEERDLVKRYSLITAEGAQTPILAGMTITEIEEE